MASFICGSCDEQFKSWDAAEIDLGMYPELEGKAYCRDCIGYVEDEIQAERHADYQHGDI